MAQKRFLVLVFFPLFLQAQKPKPFKISGTSAYYKDSNLVIQVGSFPVTFNDYTLSGIKKDSLHLPGKMVKNGEIDLSGTMLYPHPFFASYYDAQNNVVHNSSFYFLNGGDDVIVTVDNLSKSHSLGNKINTQSNREYERLKRFYSKTVDPVTGRVMDMQAKQKLMKAYIGQHPNSYVALWDLFFDFAYIQNNNDNQRLLANTKLFSPQLKRSNTYRHLVEIVSKRLILSAGATFPNLDIKPALPVQEVVKKNRFTLIDFWYSHCQPCLQQLPNLKRVYANHNVNGFSIVGISVDKKEHEADWQRVIQQTGLPWPQYLDLAGKESKNLGIDIYPTNFLVDDKGVIVKKDISPEELNDFLQKNLRR